MGIVFGKTGVAEPKYESLLCRSSCDTPYEVREYGTRFAIETDVVRNETGLAFRRLAGYIGVGSTPQNEGVVSIAMTAPVSTASSSSTKGGTTIAMTAPVSTSRRDDQHCTMAFYLPSEYDAMSKIPKPTNPDVRVCQVPPASGVAHTFHGSVDAELATSKVKAMVRQLNADGLSSLQEKDAIDHHLLWQFNPPFTIPYFRKNEIWIPLTSEQIQELVT